MSTYTQILYQIVFGASNLNQFLYPESQNQLFKYIANICRNMKCEPYSIGGHKNHIHMMISLHRSVSLSQLVKDVKLSSGIMMKENNSDFKNFKGWQVGYGGFSYNYSEKEKLIKYVERQEEHHKKTSFTEEIMKFYRDFGIDFEMKYLFI